MRWRFPPGYWIVALALAAGFASAPSSAVRAQAPGEVQVTVLAGVAPVAGAEVGLDLNGNGQVWADTLHSVLEDGDRVEVTGLDGIAFFGALVGVGDGGAPRTLVAGGLRGNVDFPRPGLDFYARPGERVSLEVFDLAGRRVTGVSGVENLSLTLPSNLASGKYHALLRSENSQVSRSFVNLGGVAAIDAHRVSLDEAVSKGWVSDSLAKSADKTESQEGNILVRKDGYQDLTQPVVFQEGWNDFTVQMVPEVSHPYSQDFAFKVRDITGANQQVLGNVVVRNASGQEFIATAGADSVYRVVVGLNDPSEIVQVWPRDIPGMTHNYVVLNPDSVGVRALLGELDPAGIVAQGTDLARSVRDTARVRADDPSLDSFVLLDYVPQNLMENSTFRNGLGMTFKCYDDGRTEILTNTAESGYTIPANPLAVQLLVNAEYAFIDVMENTPDGRPLWRTTAVDILPIYSGDYENVSYSSILNGSFPSNDGGADYNGDGYQDSFDMTIQESDGFGTALAEKAGKVVRDVDDTATYALQNAGTEYNSLFRSMAATWAKFKNGTNFYD